MNIDSLKLSPEERIRRRTQGLCLYCGGKGHVVVDCPTRPTRSGVSSAPGEMLVCNPLCNPDYFFWFPHSPSPD